jgi:hypothetical protein
MGIEKVELSAAAPAPLTGATQDWTGVQQSYIARPKILLQDPASENPKHVQYSFDKDFANHVVPGDMEWVFLPGLGRFVLSLRPLPELGFRLAGEVQRETIRVAMGDVRFDVVSSKTLLDSPDAFRLYVRAERDFKPQRRFSTVVEPDQRVPRIDSVAIEELELRAR